MSYAVKIGTIEAIWVDRGPIPDGCVRFDGVLVTDRATLQTGMVWDDQLQNVRPLTAQEIAQRDATAQAATKREAQIQAAMRAFAVAAVDNGVDANAAFEKAVLAGKPKP